jgi:mRNA-degrading endonuclease YafQ of YafQ-DinJ toxin-antitoxin module
MAYYIFLKNSDNIEGSICKIAETQSDLNNLNINQTDYKIIENTSQNFDDVKTNNVIILKYSGESITFITKESFFKRTTLTTYINNQLKVIKQFLNNNKNHPLFQKWSDYYNILSNLDVNIIITDDSVPLTISLEQYLKNQSKSYLNTLQVP